MANERNRMQRLGRRHATPHGIKSNRWRRLRNQIIAWGALAGALAAIVNLWPSFVTSSRDRTSSTAPPSRRW